MRRLATTAPDGTIWRVRVVWQPRWSPLARRFGGWRAKSAEGQGQPREAAASGGWGGLPNSFDADNLLVGIAAVIGVIVLGLLFWWLLLPLLLLLVDLTVVVAILAVAIPARVLLRRPWTVEAVSVSAEGDRQRITKDVVGWRAALRTRDDFAQRLQAGYPAPDLAGYA